MTTSVLKQDHLGVLGATSLAGQCLLQQLSMPPYTVHAFSRDPHDQVPQSAVEWMRLGSGVDSIESVIPAWICLAPIWVLPDYFSMLQKYGAKRVVVVSSTSRFTKDDSSDPEEQAVALRLAEAEDKLQAWASTHQVEWIILRPTLIYGLGQDKNISEIARFIQRFGFFPLFGAAQGKRQPIHVEDVTAACIAAMHAPAALNCAYNISGAETLAYRDMVAYLFVALNRTKRIATVPLWMFSAAVAVLRRIPRYRKWTTAMAQRMNRDMVFDHSAAIRDFGFNPRKFVLYPKDIP